MRVFYALLIILAATVLFMLPMTNVAYDFLTDLRTDTFSVTTTPVGTTANVTLLDDLYDCPDTVSVDINSDNATENPLPSSANCTTRVLLIEGLSANTTRTLEVTYAFDPLEGFDAIKVVIKRIPFIWMLVTISFGPAALIALFTRRAG